MVQFKLVCNVMRLYGLDNEGSTLMHGTTEWQGCMTELQLTVQYSSIVQVHGAFATHTIVAWLRCLEYSI